MILALASIAGAGLGVYRWQASHSPALCQVCDRVVPKQTAYRIEMADGTLKACCPACAMHFLLHHPGTVRESWASDFGSGRLILASSAFYDEGGDTQYCTAHHPGVERGPQGVSTRVFDRCLPTLVAFATKDDAERYRQQHGGRVVDYAQALESLRSQ
jgi:hypothetical protein